MPIPNQDTANLLNSIGLGNPQSQNENTQQPVEDTTTDSSSDESTVESQSTETTQDVVSDTETSSQESTDSTESATQDTSSADDSDDDDDDVDYNWYDGEGDDSTGTIDDDNFSSAENDFLKSFHEATGVDVTSYEAAISHVQKVQADFDKYKQEQEQRSNEVFANEEMKRANEVAKNGGDWQSYLGLSNTDYDAISDEDIYAAVKLQGLFDTNEEMQDYLDTVDPTKLKIEAREIRNQLKQQQEHDKRKIEHAAIEQKRNIDQGIRKALDSTTSMYGMKITAADRRKIHQDLTSGKFLKDLFHGKDGKPDYDKLTKLAYLQSNVKKIVQKATTVALNRGKKEMLDEATNSTVTRSKGTQPQAKSKEGEKSIDNVMGGLLSGEIKFR
jgi:hypothetical protein